MSREIKFRAWDKKEKKMIYEGKIDQWKDDYGDEDYTRVHIHFDGSLSGHISDDGGKNGFWEHDAGLKEDRLILLQFTGLKDKNGREIYEGDILDTHQHHYGKAVKVEWNETYAGFSPFCDYDSDCGIECDNENCEVIGNIYENPELLGPTAREDGWK